VPDAVVIGAGHNGLVAANLLVDAGWDVVVVEAQQWPGGAVRTAEVTAPGFRTDLFSAFYPLSAASPVIRDLHLEEHGLAWAVSPAVLTHVSPNDTSVTLWQDAERTAAELDAVHSGDGAEWLRLTRQWDRIGPTVVEALLQPFPPVGPTSRLVRQLGIGAGVRLARLAAQPVRRFGDEAFGGSPAALLFAGNALHADLSPDSAGSALYGWLLSMLGHSHGYPVPIGGAGRLIDALVSRLESKGGVVRLNAPVTGIDIANGSARGVVLACGERLSARRAVLADVAAPQLFAELVGPRHLPARFMADLAHFEWDLPTLKIDWALSRPVPWTAPNAGLSGTVHLGVDMDGFSDYSTDLSTRRVPRHPFLLFGQMTTADVTRSPEGTESAWAYTHLPRGRTLSPRQIDRHVALVESVVERHAPGFGASVLGRYVQSPADLQSANANLVSGAVNGGTAQLHQQLVFRPVPGLSGAATPVDRLFLGGASAHPGGGVHGACGSNAAYAAIRRAGPGGRARRATEKALFRQLY
jgi:phytoene dehydrogenase-like protein